MNPVPRRQAAFGARLPKIVSRNEERIAAANRRGYNASNAVCDLPCSLRKRSAPRRGGPRPNMLLAASVAARHCFQQTRRSAIHCAGQRPPLQCAARSCACCSCVRHCDGSEDPPHTKRLSRASCLRCLISCPGVGRPKLSSFRTLRQTVRALCTAAPLGLFLMADPEGPATSAKRVERHTHHPICNAKLSCAPIRCVSACPIERGRKKGRNSCSVIVGRNRQPHRISRTPKCYGQACAPLLRLPGCVEVGRRSNPCTPPNCFGDARVPSRHPTTPRPFQ